MSEKSKPKTSKKKKASEQQSVLGNLPATRPNRLARRHAEPATTEAPPAEAPAATEPRATEPAKKAGTRTTTPKPAAAKAKPRATAAAAKDKPRATAATSKPTPRAPAAASKPAAKRARPAAKPKAGATDAEAPKTFQPTVAADEAAAPVAEAPAPKPVAEAPAPKTFESTAAAEGAAAAPPKSRPRPVRPGSPSLEQPERREPAPPPSNGGTPRGTELVTTAIQAAGELTKIGITVGSQIVKRTLDRLPRR